MRRFGLCLLVCWVNTLWAGQIQQMDVGPELSGVRLTFALSPGTQHRYFLMQNPDRLVLDLLNTQRGNFELDASRYASPLVGGRVTQRDADLRIVFTLDGPSKPQLFKLKNGAGKAERLIVELPSRPAPPKPEPPKPEALQSSVAAPASDATMHANKVVRVAQKAGVQLVEEPKLSNQSKSQTPKIPPVVLSSPPPIAADTSAGPELTPATAAANQVRAAIKGRKIVVAIDAGHGGKDTGALGAKGVREKDVVLGIARELADMLGRDGRYKVVMIRSGDTFVPLKGRRDKARQFKADLFISIHADAFSTAEATGASVFALSQRGATSEMARFLAASENNSDLAGTVGGVNLDDKDEVLAGVLVDLSMTATLANSLDVGARVLRELGKVTRLHNRQVEQAGFLVLKSPDVPSILVETGFISNPREAQQLATQAHRERVARAVFAGVRSYFSASAPPVELATATRGGPEASADHINPQPGTPKMASRSAMREAESGARVAPQAPHLVVVGDTLEKIARRYGVTQQAILAANKMTSTTVKTGQRLKIPVN